MSTASSFNPDLRVAGKIKAYLDGEAPGATNSVNVESSDGQVLVTVNANAEQAALTEALKRLGQSVNAENISVSENKGALTAIIQGEKISARTIENKLPAITAQSAQVA